PGTSLLELASELCRQASCDRGAVLADAVIVLLGLRAWNDDQRLCEIARHERHAFEQRTHRPMDGLMCSQPCRRRRRRACQSVDDLAARAALARKHVVVLKSAADL